MQTINMHALGDVLTKANVLDSATLNGAPARVDYNATRTAHMLRVTTVDGLHTATFPLGLAVRVITQKRSQFLARN